MRLKIILFLTFFVFSLNIVSQCKIAEDENLFLISKELNLKFVSHFYF